jgi:hypothetical protein
MPYAASVAGRFARAALELGTGEVCAQFRRSFYLRFPGERYACVGDASLGRGPLNVLVDDFSPAAFGTRVSVSLERATAWTPPPAPAVMPNLGNARTPAEGLGGLVLGEQNALSIHAQPALDALAEWLSGNALRHEAEELIGLGPGLTPSGDDYLGGMLVALRLSGRGGQADALWRWLEPRLAARTSAISAAHLAAAAAGEAHEALHVALTGKWNLDALSAVGHCSGWDALAGAVAVLRDGRSTPPG